MAQNIALAIIELWLLSAIAVALHRIRPRYGLTLLLSFTLGLVVLLQTPAIAVSYVAIADQFLIILGITVLIPVILMVVLILYILEGTFVARQVVYGILGVTVLAIVITRLFLFNVQLPGGGNWLGLPVDASVFSFDLRSTIASFIAFAADLYSIVIVYQVVTNYVSRAPRWLSAGVGLLAALSIDTILYNVIAFGYYPGFLFELSDDLLTKLVAGVLAWPVLAIYLGWLAPRFIDTIGREKRPIFDLLFGTVAQMETALQEAELASQHNLKTMQNLRAYLGDASHDLRSPLAAIKLRLHMLMISDTEIQRHKHISIIREQAERLENMVEDLLLLSRLDEIEELHIELTDLNPIVQTSVDAVQSLATAKNQSLKLHLAESLPLVQISRDDILRSLTNLIENAIRYTPNQGMIEVKIRSDKKTVVIEISDNGYGIAEIDLPHIFDRFYRSKQAIEANITGTGLGLAIVKKIVDKHKGRIEVDSVLGKGTTFLVHLPTTTE